MVKPESSLRLQHENEANSSSCKFKGVRKRKWGKYVSEIRLPNSRKRIWLGSFDTAEKAARAFDAALYCLRGNSAKFNFPNSLPDIVNSRSLTPEQIRVEAARFANSYIDPGRVEDSEHDQSSSISSLELHVDSPSISISGDEIPEIPSDTELLSFSGGELSEVPSDEEYPFSAYGAGLPEMPLDNEFLNSFLTLGSTGNINDNLMDYEIFPGYDDLCVPEMPLSDNSGIENFDFFPVEGSSFLWNF